MMSLCANFGDSPARLRRMKPRQKKKSDRGALSHEEAIIAAGYAHCDFNASHRSDCDVCRNATIRARLFVAISQGEVTETDHYACPSCALFKASEMELERAWWKTALPCPACGGINAAPIAFELQSPTCDHCAPYGLVSPEVAAKLAGLSMGSAHG